MRPGFFWCKGNRAGVWHGMWMRSLNVESDGKGKMKEKLRLAVFGHKRWSREGGVEIVVKELCTRMAQQGCQVTCYNRAGHHVSGAEYDDAGKTEYEGIRQKPVPTIERRGARDIIRGCHNRDKGTAENERLRNPKFIFSYPKNERLIFLGGRNAAQEEISTMRVGGDSQRTGERAYPLFVLAEILMKKLSGIVGKIYE